MSSRSPLAMLLGTMYRRLRSASPGFSAWLHSLYCRACSRVRKRIAGTGNRICRGRAVLSGVVFDIVGDRNTIEIQDGCFLKDLSFRIRGNGHRIHLSPGVRFNRGGSIWLEDHDERVEIGSRTTFEDVHIGVTEGRSVVRMGTTTFLHSRR